MRPAAVLVNYGSHRLLAQNVLSGDDPLGRTADVVVVDNWYSAAERAAITALCAEHGWQLVAQEGNPGFGSACNAGIRAAAARGARQVLLVNPDAVVTGQVAVALGEQVRRSPDLLVSPLIVDSDGRPYFRGSRVDLRSGRIRSRRDDAAVFYLESDDPRWRDWVSGACLAFDVDLWSRAGGLSERYFLYWEDVDFSHRCVQAGARLCLRQDLHVVHDEGATHGAQRSRARSTTYYFYNCRNRLLYARLHLTWPDRIRWLVRTPTESWQILLRGGRRQILESPRTLGAAVAGSIAGIGLLLRPGRRLDRVS